MNEDQLGREIERLNSLVDRCGGLMKKRLAEKAKLGYTGWDDQILIPTITGDLQADVAALTRHFNDMLKKSQGLLPLAPDPSDITRIVDVMNRAAFLLNALLEGDFNQA